MNYLAHLFLSGHDKNILIGNFIGDFVTSKQCNRLPFDIQQGIIRHRWIDSYTDAHPCFRKGVRRLRPNHGKYAPVVLDILYDHLLAIYWQDYSERTLKVFSEMVYTVLENINVELPPKAEMQINALLQYRYLLEYASRQGITGVLERMDKRARFPSNFAKAADELYANMGIYEPEFRTFMGDILEDVSCSLS